MRCVPNLGLECKLACFMLYWSNSILDKNLHITFNFTHKWFLTATYLYTLSNFLSGYNAEGYWANDIHILKV